jgi:hypothetical protein
VTGYATDGWGELFLAEAGASAALGGEVLVVGLVAWSILTAIWIRALRAPVPDQPRWVPVLSMVVTQAATVPMVVAGVSLLEGP